MKKIFEFIKLYAYTGKKKYLYFSFQLVSFCFLFHLVFNSNWEISKIKQTLESVNASDLYFAEMNIGNINNLSIELAKMQENLPQEIEMIAVSKKQAFSDKLYGNKQVTLEFLSQKEILQYRYSISKGDYFKDINYGDNIYPAVVPKKLSNKYKIGNTYDIGINKNFKPLQSIKIQIIGVRNDNFILEHTFANINVSKRNNTILIFDQIGEIYNHFYNNIEGSISIIFKSPPSYSESLFISTLENYEFINIKNIEKTVLTQKGLTYKDLSIYTTLLIVIFPLIIISMASFFYLDFQNRKRDLFIFTSCGIDLRFYSLSIFIINLAFFIVPVLFQEILWFLICLSQDIRFIWLHSLLILAICSIAVILVTFLNSYFFNKINYDDIALDKEVINE